MAKDRKKSTVRFGHADQRGRNLVLKRAKAKKKELILEAREDPAAFVQYAFRNEKNGRKIKNADFHVAWHKFLTETRWGVIIAPIEHGKSSQIGVGRVVWEIGNNPNIRILLLGESGDSAEKLLQGVRQQIEVNPRIAEVFPHLRKSPRRSDKWNDRNITVERDSIARDPTVQARGIGSRNILGSRLDLVVFDDGLNTENTRTKASRDKVEAWFDTVVFTRLVDDYENNEFGRIFAIGTPWDPDDLLHRLAARKGWRSIRFSAVENPDDEAKDWRVIWPAQWPLQRLLDKRGGMTEIAFARKLLCRVLTEGLRRFKKIWIDHMFALGKNRTMLDKQPRYRGTPLRCFTGVDFGIGQGDTAALTVLFTIAIDHAGRRIPVDVRSGRWQGPEVLSELRTVQRTYDSLLCLESNAAQKWMGQFAETEGLPVFQLHTGQNKHDEEYGVESLAVEMRSGLWVAPSGPEGNERPQELVDWARELYDYDPASHTGDHVMSSWKAREGARLWNADRTQPSEHQNR